MNWNAAEDGLPWSQKKMNNAINNLKNGGSIGFALGYEKLNKLKDLDEKVFSVRNDLILHIWSVENDNIFTEEQLEIISDLKNIKKLKLSGFNNIHLPQIGKLKNLEKLIISSHNKLDISFLEELPDIEYLFLIGKFSDLGKLEACTGLKNLYLQQTTINNLEFLLPLTRLSTLMIDYSRVNCNLTPLEKLNISDLKILSITNLSDVSFLGKMKHLEKLRLDASKVEYLPDFKELKQLECLKLNYMKIWKNPEILKSIESLKELELHEINPKLKAEQFYFLSTMKSLKEVDYRFIDFNKKRIQKLNDFFEKEGKTDLIKK